MRHLRSAFMLLAILGLATVAGAQEFFEDFESYAADSEMHGQGGWKGWNNTPSAGAPVSGQYAYSGSNSVEIIGAADLVHEFDIAGGRREVKAMQYIPSGTTGETWFILLNSYDDNANQDWSAQVVFNLATGVLNSQEGGGTAEIIYDTWVELRFLINLDKNTVDVYYNGEMFTSHQWDDTNHNTIGCIDLYGNGASSVYYDDISISQYFIYQANEPTPADGAIGVTAPLLRWTPGDTALFHDVYLGTSPDLTEADLVSPGQMFTMYYMATGLEPGATYYWRVDETTADMSTTYTGDVWSFTALPLTAYGPSPADEAALSSQALDLSWLSGQNATEQHVYFGDSYDAVAAGDPETDKGVAAENVLSTGLLRAGSTYYWRVDTTDDAGQLQVGEVWSFTTGQPVEGKIVREWWTGIGGTAVSALTGDARYPSDPDGSELLDLFEGPVGWRDNYGSRLFGWLKPAESGDYTFWISSDDYGELWLSTDADPANVQKIAEVPGYTSSREWTKYPDPQESDPIALEAGQKYYIEALMKEAGGGDNIAVAWQPPGGSQHVIPGEFIDTYALPPVRAAAPSPPHGALDTPQSLTLSWFAGENAVQHDVYLGDDAQAAADADTSTSDVYKGRQTTTSAPSGALEWGKTYYWRVDEVQGDGTILKGAVWRFTTAEYIPVDTFESYTNEVGQRVFEVWVDGVGFSLPEPGNPGNGTGMAVGHDVWTPGSPHYNGTIMETGNVAQGDQAMPLNYDNTAAPYYSEAERTWAAPQDWTAEGVDTLSLWIKGKADNAAEAVYITITDNAGNAATIVNPDPAAATNANWTEWPVALSDVADAGVDVSVVKSMAIGAGNPDAPTPGGSGLLLIDDIRVMEAVAEQ